MFSHLCTCEWCKKKGGIKGNAYYQKHDPPATSSIKISHCSSNNQYFKIMQIPKYVQEMPKSTWSLKEEVQWISQPLITNTYDIPIKVNNNQIIVHSIKYRTSGFWKYNMNKCDECDLIVSDSYIGSKYFSMYSYNENKNQIYLFGDKTITCIDLLDGDDINMEKFHIPFHIQNGTITQINHDTYHIIGDLQKHLIWNVNCKHKMQTVAISANHKFYDGHAAVYLKSKNKLVTFGGSERVTSYWYGNNVVNTYIWEYDTNSATQWNKFDNELTLPSNVCNLGYIVSDDDRYLVLFGNMYGSKYMEDDVNILVYDLEEKQMIKSVVKCPTNGKFYALLMTNCIDNHLLVSAYLKRIKHAHSLPMDMINLIKQFFTTPYSSDYVHLFEHCGKGHWKMCLDFILRTDVC